MAFSILSSEVVGRFIVREVRTRFGDVQWMVEDSTVQDWTGLPAVIRQEPTREAALRGLVVVDGARRCDRHGTVISSPCGRFDTTCGPCEQEADEADGF